MATTENFRNERVPKKRCNQSASGNTVAGVILLLVGTALFLRQMGVYLPYWLFSWEMIPIVIGLFIGAREGFRPGGWLIPIFIGAAFLIDDIVPDVNVRKFIWPSIFIIIGLVMILRPWRARRRFVDSLGADAGSDSVSSTGENVLDVVSIFSSTKKTVLSKEFKGGEIVCVFGGNEINLSQADFASTATLEIAQVFGGTKITIPANWRVQSDVTSIFAGLDDKRPSVVSQQEPVKTLRIIGSNVFGGIEIVSY